MAEAFAVLPAGIRVRLMAYEIEDAARKRLRGDEFTD
jgi:hypothetical protein